MAIKKVAMIGAGSMGGGMALLLAEKGISVSIEDPSESTVDALIKSAEEQGIHNKLSKHEDYEDLCKSLDSPKVFFFSLPHGTVGDSVVEGLHPYLDKGDVIVDCSNEHWENTQRRQGKLIAQGVYYLGCGVSGGYQAARRGPSMCPGGDDRALELCLPMFEMIAAKASDGSPCVGKIGEGGAGHYVKMIHNGIEHAMMSAISEAWEIMHTLMGMEYDAIGKVFEKWGSEGEFKNTFLIQIGADICETKDKGHHVLSDIKDKVVQDIDGSEGTGIWSNTQAVDLHNPAPTLTAAHYLRIASAFLDIRQHVEKIFHGSFLPAKIEFKDEEEKDAFIEDLRKAVYATCLASYIQGFGIIDKADKANKWSINYAMIVQIWRAGCIIQSDHINSLLHHIFNTGTSAASPHKNHNLLYEPTIVSELKSNFPSLKRVVLKGVETNANTPSMSATLEYLKYMGNLKLPTQFYEAELDYFGKHMYDSKSEDKGPGLPMTGKHHYEWKPA